MDRRTFSKLVVGGAAAAALPTGFSVAPLLAARGYRVIVPYLRGHGSTRFLSTRTSRNAHRPRSPSTSSR
ncbi:hypothetical protein [Planotetraspora kaengkrachanensis]|uniref:Twin-arginine translocation signal domain-containing protein n=1 Tax=Planotetraspora kaengkrachanensis TaxID=575193 RepID=A0A8J3PXM7_9ACTN|nr:hypothetical protein [Planotetraspora kaengkrachanensis]GIG82980.1 hypothetical protein Pka01_61070 [Planotetraspora kaengkrachanensis]